MCQFLQSTDCAAVCQNEKPIALECLDEEKYKSTNTESAKPVENGDVSQKVVHATNS